MSILITLLVAFGGLIVYILASNPKAVELGRIMFFCGLLAFLLQRIPESVAFLR
jgi:Na+/phosphate symporter